MDLRISDKVALYRDIVNAKKQGRKLLAILLDPDKIHLPAIDSLISSIGQSPATHIFVGGSIVVSDTLGELVRRIKILELPIVLFPGHPSQITADADGILLLSLVSGRNPDYLIGHHVTAAPILANLDLEIIPTGYILIDGGCATAVATVSMTKPIAAEDINLVTATALASRMMGNKLVYLEAGSGASRQVPLRMIKAVSETIDIPLIVGGGIASLDAIRQTFEAGADLVVIGTAYENDANFFIHY